jgi:hypothetical protein
MEIPDALKSEVKALVDEIARPFNTQIADLDRKADQRWNEFKATPDAVIGESVKAILTDALKTRDDRAAAIEKGLTERLDTMEAKAKERGMGWQGQDPDAEVKASLDKLTFRPDEIGNKARFTAPLSFIGLGEQKTVATITNALNGGKPDMEGDAAYQTEGSAKATMDAYTEIIRADVVTIAVTARVSQQIFDDRSAFISWLRERMGYRVIRYLDRQQLAGAGTTGTLDGINTVATAYGNSHLGVVEAVQKLDIIRFGRLQVELADYMPDGVVLHPTDWAGIETLKDGDERYLIGDPRTGGSMGVGRVASVWGMPVVSTTGQTLDAFTVGDFRGAAQLFMRQGLEILASTEDQDNFVKNLVTIRAELRAVQAIYATAAFVTGDFSTAIAAT